ncbi:putative peptide chain release factor 1 protein [Phaeoacremonium minimum UCRPA7]|uniref:Putative peptide chain release factor 1 protein n=1 Tax=Phaeoacremonium minimum (strain UCR-PA7) TaxID=1286976 RepID=R8BTI5_PHAM7|nr:putative peptide chain release factor 1 protein [Phaeoacremonium minimum UCRPA7]EOO02619.1 putative peptide chain release factor 1 protein [Phaeoacremonium minimum UCRPA7]
MYEYVGCAMDSNGALPPVLLARARKLAAEHQQLSAALATDFDTTTAKRAGEISGVALALREWETAKASISELTGLLQSSDEEMRQLAEDELESTNTQLATLGHNLRVSLTPKHGFAAMPCLLEVRPGPGGLEGRFFADTLVKMYQQYCSRKGYRARLVKYEVSDSAGDASGSDGESPLQEAVLEVQDTGAYDIFRGEAGMHRVQRIPSTEKSGRTHTSAVAVWVLPSFPENESEESADFSDPESDFYINPQDVRTETMKARGAGGQHVNKTESAIRLTHIPSGTVVSMQDSRSQHRNREWAWRLLRSRVAQQRKEAREELAHNLRNSVLSKSQVTRGDKIRTYNYSQDRCTDHRSGLNVHNLPNVLVGGEKLDEIIDSVKDWLAEEDIQAVIAEEEAAAIEDEKKGKK